MIHRVILGAMERFIGVLIEHYAGAFPTWLAPVQAILLTVTDAQIPYGEEVYRKLISAGIRAEKDFRNEKLGMKIREAELQKVPYMAVLGNREMAEKTLTPRGHSGRSLKPMKAEEFIEMIRKECLIGGESYS